MTKAIVRRYESWSRLPIPPSEFALFPADGAGDMPFPPGRTVLPFGGGRTYGDTCVNPGEGIVDTSRLDRVLAFDERTGLVTCESGTTLGKLLDVLVPHGWFVPVCPGTKLVTVGGMLAHDVHGKNQPGTGTFGCHVESFELLRSPGQWIRCSAGENPQLFRATIGGLGLTGLVLTATIHSMRVSSAWFRSVEERCDLDGFLAHVRSAQEHEYCYGWVDSLAGGEPGARCVLSRGEHAPGPAPSAADVAPRRRLRMPGSVPAVLFNRRTVRALNLLYYGRVWWPSRRTKHYDAFLFPQDSLHASNRIYGRRGVFAYHCLLPWATAREGAMRILERVSRPGDESLVTVLKAFGEKRSPGMLSFAGPGLSIVCGFPNEGARTLDLLAELDDLVAGANGIHYPAKDARLPAAAFQRSYPQWREFRRHVDPRFSSSFWRRVSVPA